MAILHPLWAKFSNLRPVLSITFPQEFRKSKKFGHWTPKSGGKKTVKRSEKHRYQKILLSKAKFAQQLFFFWAAILHPLLVKFSNLRPVLSITFPQGFQISKIFGHPTSENGGKKTFKRYLKSDEYTDRQTDTQMDKSTFRKHRPRGPMLWKV